MPIFFSQRNAAKLGLVALVLAWPMTLWGPANPNPNFQQGPTNPFIFDGAKADGRLVPEGGVVHIAAPAGMQGPAIVAKLLVKTDDWVEAGQLLAVLNTQPLLEAQYNVALGEQAAATSALVQTKAAETRVNAEMQMQLADFEARAALADANAHKAAESSRLALESAQRDQAAAQTALAAGQRLEPVVIANATAAIGVVQVQVDIIPKGRDEHKVAAAQLEQAKAGADRAKLEMAGQIEQLQAQADLAALRLKQAQANLILEPAPSDASLLAPVQIEARSAKAAFDLEHILVDAAKAEQAANVAGAQGRLAAADTAVALAKAQLALAEIHAPSAGRVLVVRAKPGEAVGPAGILDLGDTRTMYVDAEVPYSDIRGVRIGQPALVSGDAFPENLKGKVVAVNAIIGNSTITSTDVLKFSTDAVVLVRVMLDNPSQVSNLVNGQVTVQINP